MNAHAAIDVVDAYVDALLDAGFAPIDIAVHAEAGAAPEVTAPAMAVTSGDTPAPPAATATRIAIAAAAIAPAAEAAPQPTSTPTPPPAPVHAIESVAPARPAAAAPLPPPAPAARQAGERAPEPARESLAAQPQRWVRVAVGADSYALELLCVQEVVRLAPIVAMRGAAPAVLGVMNLRGRIVPVFDLGLWLGAGQVQPDERSRIVVVERDDELIGVLVSAVEDVVTLSRDRIEPPVPGADPGATLGVARVGAAPTVLLDAGALYG